MPKFNNYFFKFLNVKYLFGVFPKYGLIAEYDLHGKPLKSWHDPSGKVIECTTAGAIYKDKLLLGSFYNKFLGLIDYN